MRPKSFQRCKAPANPLLVMLFHRKRVYIFFRHLFVDLRSYCKPEWASSFFNATNEAFTKILMTWAICRSSSKTPFEFHLLIFANELSVIVFCCAIKTGFIGLQAIERSKRAKRGSNHIIETFTIDFASCFPFVLYGFRLSVLGFFFTSSN